MTFSLRVNVALRDVHVAVPGEVCQSPPQEQTIRAAMDRAQVANSGHTLGHTGQKTDLENTPVLTPTI